MTCLNSREENVPPFLQWLTRVLDFSWAFPKNAEFRRRYQILSEVFASCRRAEKILLNSQKTTSAKVAFLEAWKQFSFYMAVVESGEPEDSAPEKLSVTDAIRRLSVEELSEHTNEDLCFIQERLLNLSEEFESTGSIHEQDESFLHIQRTALFDLERVERQALFDEFCSAPAVVAKAGFAIGALVLCVTLLLSLYHLLKPRDAWRVEYFRGSKFSRTFRIAESKEINFQWGTDSPIGGLRPDHFSLRATSCLQVDREVGVAFELGSDDGARVFLGNDLLIDRWGPNPYSVTTMGTPRLVSMGVYPVKVDYFELTGGAALTLAVLIDRVPIENSSTARLVAPLDTGECPAY
jgi:hypothetical protein